MTTESSRALGAKSPPARSAALSRATELLLKSYESDTRAQRINRQFVPSKSEVVALIDSLFQLIYPGYFGRRDLTDSNVADHIAELLLSTRARLIDQVELALRHVAEEGESDDVYAFAATASRIADDFLERLPAVRALLISDLQAAYDGDPAATSLDEVIICYPGFFAITVYRLAHELHTMHVPLIPRIMSEWAHTQTGADIHPGAKIGASFFLDHASGAVIGETTEIGANVKIYQGVTLGALSLPKDELGRAVRGGKRHPRVEDNVTIYANATVLGGQTVVGEGSVLGGSVFITQSVPARNTITYRK